MNLTRLAPQPRILDCGGKRSATPLLDATGRTESGVAAALQSSLRFASAGCHRSPNLCRPCAKLHDCSTDFGGPSSARPKLQLRRDAPIQTPNRAGGEMGQNQGLFLTRERGQRNQTQKFLCGTLLCQIFRRQVPAKMDFCFKFKSSRQGLFIRWSAFAVCPPTHRALTK